MPKTSINLTHNPLPLPKLYKNLPKIEKFIQNHKFFEIHKLKHKISNQTEKIIQILTQVETRNWKSWEQRDVCLFWLLRHKLWFDKKRRAKIPSFHKLKKIFLAFLDRFLCLGRTRNWWNLWRGFASGRRRRPWRRRFGNRGEFLRKICEKFRENKSWFREKLDLT